ncbi:MAG: UvrD-helicase domain-containing protein [Candidatus Magasanikbacteria bacterium]
MINFEQELNKEQQDVVLNGDGPCLVLAGAGSGKTRTITYRVAYLLEKGVAPENILLVTFTNRAAQEMIERVQRLMSFRAQPRNPLNQEIPPLASLSRNDTNILPWSGTFHHIANKILRIFATHLGYKNNFTVLDADDSQALIKMCIKEFKTTERFPSAKVVGAIISFARNSQKSIEETVEDKFSAWWHLSKTIGDISSRYEQKKKEANAMDFDDLLINLALLLNLPGIQEKFSNQFQYILVDEYQDTNKLQANIIDRLAKIHRNILVVGDDAQSIYSFRAADIKNILNFEEKYPDAKIFRLETNYRSHQEILSLANGVIANNRHQYPKKLKAIKAEGIKPNLYPKNDQSDEASFVVKKINELIDQGTSPHHIAVLFRAAHHSQMLEMELAKAGILYDYRGGLRFFDRAHIKDVLGYLRILNNLSDSTAWLRVLLHEEGVGSSAAKKIIEAVQKLENVDELKNLGQILGGKAQTGFNNFLKIFNVLLESYVPENNPGDLVEAIINSRYSEYLTSEYLDSEDRKKDLEQMATFAAKHKNLSDFLSEASLQESFAKSTTINQKQNEQQKRLVLSTIHQAKGLEWEVVFIINIANDAFPNSRAMSEQNGLEEERRLFYVAITRAKKHLFLTYPMSTESWGSTAGPSLFLSEISQDLIDDHSILSYKSTVFDNDDGEIQYIPEDQPFKITPGSFLRNIDDL